MTNENLSVYDRICRTRKSGRATASDYINATITDFVELHGDRCFADDHAIVGGIGRLNGKPVTVIGIEKGRDLNERLLRNFGCVLPEGYRKALRLIKQAEKFHRPVICFVDTQFLLICTRSSTLVITTVFSSVTVSAAVSTFTSASARIGSACDRTRVDARRAAVLLLFNFCLFVHGNSVSECRFVQAKRTLCDFSTGKADSAKSCESLEQFL